MGVGRRSLTSHRLALDLQGCGREPRLGCNWPAGIAPYSAGISGRHAEYRHTDCHDGRRLCADHTRYLLEREIRPWERQTALFADHATVLSPLSIG
jgi:hypothetical protein